MNVFQWIKQCSENFKARHRKYWINEGPPSVFEALESEMYMKDLDKTIPNSIFMKLDTERELTCEVNCMVDTIREGNWYV